MDLSPLPHKLLKSSHSNRSDFPDFAGDSIQILAGNSAHFYLDVLTPGLSLTADSGHDYSNAAIPEPSTAGPFAGGILWLATAWPCQRQARGATRG
jgi:hypothetical protein